MAGTPANATVYNSPYDTRNLPPIPTGYGPFGWTFYHGGSANLPLLISIVPLRFGRRYGFFMMRVPQPPQPQPPPG